MGTIVKIQNSKAILQVDLAGGAIIDFHLKENSINPLNFNFSHAQMPANNKKGAAYKGHFACIGRWGKPSKNEMQRGVPNHGQPGNLFWDVQPNSNESLCKISVTSPIEGLEVNKTIKIDKTNPIIIVTEKIKNINSLGRLFNIVQHPTLSKPFLTNDIVIDCNADMGFNQLSLDDTKLNISKWPIGKSPDIHKTNLSKPTKAHDSIFSFLVNKKFKLGWITAYSPSHQLMIGYIWRKADYPWINLWQKWIGTEIKYKGIEFGTTGVHKPFKEIIMRHPKIFGENTFSYIDTDEIVSKYLTQLKHFKFEVFSKKVKEITVESFVVYGDKTDVAFNNYFFYFF